MKKPLPAKGRWYKRYLHHVVLGHQDRLLLLQAVRTSLAPNLGPLDPGWLVGGAWTQGEEAGEQDGSGQLLADGLMGHFTHIDHSVSAAHTCRDEENQLGSSYQLPQVPCSSDVKNKMLLHCLSECRHTILPQPAVCPTVKQEEQRPRQPL